MTTFRRRKPHFRTPCKKLEKLDSILEILNFIKNEPAIIQKSVSCIAGFELLNGKCVDIDECLKAKVSELEICRDYSLPMVTIKDENGDLFAKTEGKCENVPGSYVCKCNSGFVNQDKQDFSSPCVKI